MTNSPVRFASAMSMSQLSYSAGVSARMTNPAKSSAGMMSRPACTMEAIVPSAAMVNDVPPPMTVTSPPTRRCSVVPAGGGEGSAAWPNAGTSAHTGAPSTSTTPANAADDGFRTVASVPVGASTARSSATISFAMAACSSSASRCTHAMDDPGMMSWNCCVRTRCHHWSMRVGLVPARADHASISCSNCSLRRLPCFVPICVLYVPRCFSKYISPTHTGASVPYSLIESVKKSATLPMVTRGTPFRSAARRARSIMVCVGPPPPSPCP